MKVMTLLFQNEISPALDSPMSARWHWTRAWSSTSAIASGRWRFDNHW